MTKQVRPGAAPHTARQEERHRRILQATAQLARRGGFDAVQMRAVAEQSEVALGTLYRYFPSKVHLLVATMQDQLEQLHTALYRHPPAAQDPPVRVTQTLMRAFRQLQREPLLADAMVRALNFGDRSVCTEVDAVSRLTTAIILDAMGVTGEPSPQQLSAVRVIGHTWHSTLVAWLSGRSSIAQVTVDIETVCTLIAPGGSATGGPATGRTDAAGAEGAGGRGGSGGAVGTGDAGGAAAADAAGGGLDSPR